MIPIQFPFKLHLSPKLLVIVDEKVDFGSQLAGKCTALTKRPGTSLFGSLFDTLPLLEHYDHMSVVEHVHV